MEAGTSKAPPKKRSRKSKVELVPPSPVPESPQVRDDDHEFDAEAAMDFTLPKAELDNTIQDQEGPSQQASKKGIYNDGYYYGWTPEWHPEFMYRIPGDVALSSIKKGGSEGRGRNEIGKFLGMDTSTKPGNRRVSSYILAAQKEHPEHVGQYQKMEGKIRMIKYFWKQSSEPESFKKLFRQFEVLTGRELRGKFFSLGTLRISDVSLRRLNDILEMIRDEVVLVPLHKVIKIIHQKETNLGYQFQIDKKSMMKCLLALQKEGFLRVFDCSVMYENVDTKIQLIAQPHITSPGCPEVVEAIQKTIDHYHAEGRVFPHGQFRTSTRRRDELLNKEVSEALSSAQLKEAQELVSSGYVGGVGLEQRYSLFRLQHSQKVILPKEFQVLQGGNSLADQALAQMLDKTKDADVMEVDEAADTSGLDESVCQETQSALELVRVDEKENTAEEKAVEDDDPDLFGVPEDSMDCNNYALNPASVLSDGVEDAFHQTLPKTLGHLIRKKDLYDPHAEYGYQAKYIRAHIIHDTVWHFVYANKGAKPDVFEKFPPNLDPLTLPEAPIEKLHVYQNDVNHYRFMPPCTFGNMPPGWFMLNDFFCALPLSILCLVAPIPKSIPGVELKKILTDPIARHTPLAGLPMVLRKPLLRDKKLIKQIEHSFLHLSAMGLMILAPNPDEKRYTTAHTSVFYVAPRAALYDTSTSEKGYSQVTQPIDRYKRYVYEFSDHEEIAFYWNHMRAISQSTELNYRLETGDRQNFDPLRHKLYSFGLFNKEQVTYHGDLHAEPETPLTPLPPSDGCAGFDSALYVHLKRHWDLNPRPGDITAWFTAWFRKKADRAKPIIEQRVQRLQRDWNSIVRTFMPTDVELTRKKRVKGSQDLMLHSLNQLIMEPKVRLQALPKGHKHKKRPLDSIDIVSQQNRLHLRCRFQPRERDMLILIRAVGFFLNPVYRFWLNPTAVRDIMHEYVPESRTKTVQSLMAAGVREMTRPERMAYLQRIVRNLDTFKEMRAMRRELSSSTAMQTQEQKMDFFKDAFRIANRLLFLESQNLPSTSSSDQFFEQFISNGQTITSAEQSRSDAPIPLRSQRPRSLKHIQHCIVTNVLVSVFLHHMNTEREYSDSGDHLVDQLNPTFVNTALQVLRADGLVSRARSADPTQALQKNHATLSYYFRHFFSHRFHVDLIEQVNHVFNYLADSTDQTLGPFGDLAGAALLAADSFHDGSELSFRVDPAIIQMFEDSVDQNPTKQIRHLETADLQLEKIDVFMSPKEQRDARVTVGQLLERVDKSIPTDALPAQPLEECLASIELCAEIKEQIRSVAHAIEAAEAYGASVEDIEMGTGLSRAAILECIEGLTAGYQIIEAGVDTRRYVWNNYVQSWAVIAGDRYFCPRPWIMPDGKACATSLRWMLESLLMAIIMRPGIELKDLKFRYQFALQPACLETLVELLVYSGCITESEESLHTNQLAGPFDTTPALVNVHYFEPVVDAISLFACIFENVPSLPLCQQQSAQKGARTLMDTTID